MIPCPSMQLLHELKRRARHAIAPVLGIGIFGYFAYHAIEGDRGLFAFMRLKDQVVEAEEVYAAARARLAPYVGGASVAIRAAKEAIDRGLEVDLETGLEIERMLFHSLFATRDREIGMQSFVENGPGKAKFEGR